MNQTWKCRVPQPPDANRRQRKEQTYNELAQPGQELDWGIESSPITRTLWVRCRKSSEFRASDLLSSADSGFTPITFGGSRESCVYGCSGREAAESSTGFPWRVARCSRGTHGGQTPAVKDLMTRKPSFS